jgi:TetR/AcrR family transcriptional regulator, transcriptional repressor for nem operon
MSARKRGSCWNGALPAWGCAKVALLTRMRWRSRWRTARKNAPGGTSGKGGCPLGSLGSQLAESDPQARTLVAAGFGRWSTAISDGLRTLQIAGHLPAGINPDDLAVTLLAALQGGLLLAQVQRDTGPLQTALDTLLALASAT